MRITGLDQASQSILFLNNDMTVQGQLLVYLRALGNRTGREFVVLRDAATERFVIQVLGSGTKTVIDQFPAEDILKQMLMDRT